MLIPNHDRLIVEIPEEEDKVTKGGIIVKMKESIMKAKVIAVGRKVEFQVGDIVMFQRAAGDEVQYGGMKLKILRPESIQATIS